MNTPYDPDYFPPVPVLQVTFKLPLFLDGPEQQTELLDDAVVRRLRARRA
ncbi:MAG: hypothetical protein HY741_24210 [Chloroflexi bacterium]|nr:hypothetical protein [Chloroflexota bacterium]